MKSQWAWQRFAQWVSNFLAPSYLTVNHVTVYRYSEPVGLGDHRMLFRPRESHDLRLRSSSLNVTPKPKSIRWVHDVFDNSLAVIQFSEPASELCFESNVTLEHFETNLPAFPLEGYAQRFPFQYSNDDHAQLQQALARHYSSDLVDDWARSFALEFDQLDTLALLRGMTSRIGKDFRYVRRETKGVQNPDETLTKKSGTCRDYAVLMMEAARSIGFAARFVSGYIYVPRAETQSVTGGGATHAWVQIYLPGAGWVDFDPTNDIVGNRNLIRVAFAWNHRQVIPLWGTYYGKPELFLGMDVTVRVTEGDFEGLDIPI